MTNKADSSHFLLALLLCVLAASPGCIPGTLPTDNVDQTRPITFRDLEHSVQWLKRSIYLIARGRLTVIDGKGVWQWTTLGTAFIAAPYRIITASHVIDNPETESEMAHHKTGDAYYLLRNDGESFHWRRFYPRLNQELFLYPQTDIAVIYLDEEFYKTGVPRLSKDDYLRIDTNFLPLGSSVGVLGYPLSHLEFDESNLSRPRVGDIFLRADAGFINTRYKTPTRYVYEFTMMFNPGNSGGPIFDLKTGKLVAVVNGYRAIPIKSDERMISDELAGKLKSYKEKAYIVFGRESRREPRFPRRGVSFVEYCRHEDWGEG